MTDILLGLIALGTLTTALLQVVIIVALVRTGKNALARIERLRAMVAPLPLHLASIRDDLARAQAIAGQQAGRVAAVYDAIEPPLRHGMMAVSLVKGLSSVFRRRPRK